MRRQAAATLLGIGLLTLGLGGCGSETPGTPAPAGGGPGTSAAKPENAPEPTGDELAKDIKIVACEAGQRAGVTAKVEVRNTLGKAWEFIGNVKFIDGSGKEIADGVFNTGTLEANATTVEEVPGANIYTKVAKVTCQLERLRLDEPGPD